MNIENKIQKNIPLAPFTTFKIGGPAKYFIEIKAKEELSEIFKWAKKNKEPALILGNGSNVLISGQGINGLVIRPAARDIAVKGERIECGAGAELAAAVRTAAGHSLTGLEWAAGIPGGIGGAIYGNAGAFGRNMADIIETVTIYAVNKNKFILFSNHDCDFSYRQSFFKKNTRIIIWHTVLRLKKGNASRIAEEMAKNISKRSNGQPKLPSAGSMFKNILIKDLRASNNSMAEMAADEKAVKGGKVGAGWLIEKSGLKGKTIGKAKVSLEHANFIVNTGGATAEEVVMLISFIKQQIRDKFGIQLQEEVQYLGF